MGHGQLSMTNDFNEALSEVLTAQSRFVYNHMNSPAFPRDNISKIAD